MRRKIALLVIPTLIAAAHALAAVPTKGFAHPMSDPAAACETARLAAWFEAQRALTDGNVIPAATLPAPAECIRSDTRAEMPKDAHHADAPTGPTQESQG